MRVNRSAAYVNNAHTRAAFFVHDRGETMHAEQLLKFRETSATVRAVRCRTLRKRFAGCLSTLSSVNTIVANGTELDVAERRSHDDHFKTTHCAPCAVAKCRPSASYRHRNRRDTWICHGTCKAHPSANRETRAHRAQTRNSIHDSYDLLRHLLLVRTFRRELAALSAERWSGDRQLCLQYGQRRPGSAVRFGSDIVGPSE